jgi:hypothetical protein
MKRFLVFFLIMLVAGNLMAQTVSSLSATGNGIKWYSSPSGGTLYTGTETLVDGQHYYASQTVAGVESATRLDITAIAKPLPSPTFTVQPGASANTATDVTYSTESGKSSYVWTYPGTLTTDYTITSGGGNTNSVTLKYVTTGSKTVTINYMANGCTAPSATSSTATTVSSPLAIGDTYLGGKIAYILVNGDPGYVAGETHGLIAAISDNATAKWGCTGTLTSATGTALGTGNQNTIMIMNVCATIGIAARLCSNLGAGWYLPSKDELYKLYLNRVAIGNFDTTATGLYWSSSEDPASNDHWNSTFYDFSNGGYQAKDKDELYKSRAIRSF